MAQIETGDVLRLGLTMSYNNIHEITNVYHVLVNDGGPRTFLAAVDDIQDYADRMVQELDTLFVTEILADHISVANATQGLTFGAIDWGAFAQGGDAGDPVAAGCCVLAWGRTYVPRVQIRKYFGVFSEVRMDDGSWGATVRNACIDTMGAHITVQEGTTGLDLLGVAWNRTLLTHTLVQSVTTSAEPAYQRRRRRGRGS